MQRLRLLGLASLMLALTAGTSDAQRLAFVAKKYPPTSLDERDREILIIVTRDSRAAITEGELRVLIPAVFRDQGFTIRDTLRHQVRLGDAEAYAAVDLRADGTATIRGQRCGNSRRIVGRRATYNLQTDIRRRYLDAASLIADVRLLAEELAQLPPCVEIPRLAAQGVRENPDTGAVRRAREMEQRVRRGGGTTGTGATAGPEGRPSRPPPNLDN